MTILVAGAGGFIGGHLVRRLIQDGHSVRAVDLKPLERWWQVHPGAENLGGRDLRVLGLCRDATRGMTEVYDLAADMGGMGFIETHKAQCMLSVLINTHLLVAARCNHVRKYFYSSSACVYAANKQSSEKVVPLAESDAYPALPEDGYGWEKLFGERMCRHFREDFCLETRVARYHNVYGPHGTWYGGREKAPAAICRKVIEAKMDGCQQIEIWGDGEQTRSFMFIDDCIEGTRRLMDSDVREPLNVGSSELVSVNQLVGVVEEIAGMRLKHVHVPGALGVRGRNSDNTRIRQLLGWEPSTRLRDGMERTYRWIYDQIAAGRERSAA